MAGSAGMMNLSSRRKLKPGDALRFANAEPFLFKELARVVCATGMLPQKELHECWQMATAVHKAFPDSLHIADLAAGHGLLAWILVLIARSEESPIQRTAVAVDIQRPKSADALAAAITQRWPNLLGSVHYVEGSVDAVSAGDGPSTLLVAVHACGSLSDRVLLAAMASHNPVAIMPCCHSLRKQTQTLASLAQVSGLPSESIESVSSQASTLGQPASIDQFRIDALKALGYEILEDFIQREITGYNRIIMGRPSPKSAEQCQLKVPPKHAEGPMKRSGEIRAFEKVSALNVSNLHEAESLSRRPSREWIRTFDLSYWVSDAETAKQLAKALDVMTSSFLNDVQNDPETGARAAWEALSIEHAEPLVFRDELPESNITIQDQYQHPVTQALAFTYRITIRSCTVEISKTDAVHLRQKLCRAVECLAPLLKARIILRGP